MSKILDSGNRRKFETGAVRDIQEGKGRMDLVPIREAAELFSTVDRGRYKKIMFAIANFVDDSTNTEHLYKALDEFTPSFKDVSTMVLEVSVHFEQGAAKYGEHNWEKGIPLHCYIDSALRHLMKCIRGDDDERHDRAFVWNILCAIWTVNNKPELNDLLAAKEEST